VGRAAGGRACPINYLLQPDHIAALLEAAGAPAAGGAGPNDELDVWGTVQKVLALHSIPVLQIGRWPVFEQLEAQPASWRSTPR
jgi:fatty-acyl-CoA synthase